MEPMNDFHHPFPTAVRRLKYADDGSLKGHTNDFAVEFDEWRLKMESFIIDLSGQVDTLKDEVRRLKGMT